MSKKIGIVLGSLREGSNTGAIAKSIQKLFPEGYEAEILDISKLEMYNQDFDDKNQIPQSYKTFRDQVGACDGYVFITPEYNRSVPAVLKNALDVASRPYGKNMWGGKTGLVISHSVGALSGFGANHHLRQILVFLNVLAVQQPEVYLGTIGNAIENGEITNQGTLGFLQQAVDAFITLLEKNN